jgi:Fe-S-cluster-containing hydrogenase component 2
MPAYRNVRLCGKDCMCLYVCPTGATDTENSIIDVTKCTSGCMACVDACPSGAISMIPGKYPPQQPKTEAVIASQRKSGLSKVRQEQIARAAAKSAATAVSRQFAEAVASSSLRMAEDILRESGYMPPQSDEARGLLEAMLESAAEDYPRDAAEMLLKNL